MVELVRAAALGSGAAELVSALSGYAIDVPTMPDTKAVLATIPASASHPGAIYRLAGDRYALQLCLVRSWKLRKRCKVWCQDLLCIFCKLSTILFVVKKAAGSFESHFFLSRSIYLNSTIFLLIVFAANKETLAFLPNAFSNTPDLGIGLDLFLLLRACG